MEVREVCCSPVSGSSIIPAVGCCRVFEGPDFLRGRQQRKKSRMPAMATAARTPTIIPAKAPPDGEESFPALFLELPPTGVVVGELALEADVDVARDVACVEVRAVVDVKPADVVVEV